MRIPDPKGHHFHLKVDTCSDSKCPPIPTWLSKPKVGAGHLISTILNGCKVRPGAVI